jgi:hypothetical protein
MIKMKTVFKIIVGILLTYALFIKLFTGLFDFFNKKKALDFWISFFEIDFPNLISIISIGFLLFLVIRKR